jgi:predicted nucleic acid-binding protein
VVGEFFDTNILIDFLKRDPAAREEFSRYEALAISIITWMEVMVGVTDANGASTRPFLSRFEVVGIDVQVSEAAVALRRSSRIKLPDAIIWATARSRGWLLAPRNTRDFPVTDPAVRVPYIKSPPA